MSIEEFTEKWGLGSEGEHDLRNLIMSYQSETLDQVTQINDRLMVGGSRERRTA